MRKPKPSDYDDGNGVDWDCYDEAMGDYEDSERDRELEERSVLIEVKGKPPEKLIILQDGEELEERNERTDERERYADYSDQEEKK